MLLFSCSKSKVNSVTHESGMRFSFCHALKICVLLLVSALLVNATPQFLSEDEQLDDDLMLSPDKRPARLSYFRAPYGGGGGGGGGSSYGRRRNNMPWDNLPNTNCLRQFCRSDNDCCRRYSKCNKGAHVCYDCWYGHPCVSNTDCCEKYPHCNPVLRTCGQ